MKEKQSQHILPVRIIDVCLSVELLVQLRKLYSTVKSNIREENFCVDDNVLYIDRGLGYTGAKCVKTHPMVH